MPELFTGLPSWLIIVCLALAFGYATSLYFRDRKNEFPGYLKTILGIVRFLAIFFISFLLLAPFVKTTTKEKEKPLLIFALDNSESVIIHKDSIAVKNDLPAIMDKLAGKLTERGEALKYYFDEKVYRLDGGADYNGSVGFNGKATDIANAVGEIGNIYTNRNVGALILVSDGIFNTGTNPLYRAKDVPFPVYTVVLGDTSIRKDLVVAGVNYNRMVYLNNKFPLEVVVRAGNAAGNQSRLRIVQQDNVLFSQDFQVNDDDFTQTFNVVLEAKRKGLQKFSVIIDPIDGELSYSNNRKDIFVEVLDAKSRILILSGAPHPDISALRQAILSNMNYEVDVSTLNDFSGKLESYSLVILHQLPSVNFPADNITRELTEKAIPALFILGKLSDLARVNQLRPGLSIVTARPSFEEAVPKYNPAFSAFSLSENTVSWFSDLPPLVAPLGDYQVANAARVLLNQRIGSIETTRPLILLNETLEGRKGIIAGEGLWKWRLYNYARFQNHQAFNELINKLVQYLSLKDQKKNFRVYQPGSFRETTSVLFDAEVYNDNYELTTLPEVQLSIINEEGKTFPYVFNKSGNSYHLDAGAFPPGNYSFRAETSLDGRTLYESGEFSVLSLDLEALNTVADHNLLYQLASETGGEMFYPADLDKLSSAILEREDIRPLTYTGKKYEDLLNKSWILVLILGLLTLEWFIRKRAGSY
ncbi:MAG: hypothetical protein RBS55_09360 [Bacteroidales bacterium]|jgi:hypothetical protein|nr:hypothetical protein [Bacteroidales bacterium]